MPNNSLYINATKVIVDHSICKYYSTVAVDREGQFNCEHQERLLLLISTIVCVFMAIIVVSIILKLKEAMNRRYY